MLPTLAVDKPPAEQFRFRRISGVSFILAGTILITPCIIWIFDHTLAAKDAKTLLPHSPLFAWLFGISLLTIWLGLTFLLDQRVVVRLDETGITDERYSPEPIPWAAVNAMWEQTPASSSLIIGLILSLDPQSPWFKQQDLNRKESIWPLPDWPYLRIDPNDYHHFSTGPRPPNLTLPLIALPKKRIIELAQHWHEFSNRPAGRRPAP
ncbi:MAG: hypothetical protein ABL901_05875 [Hyphomicrobiaceae bacterium]